MPRLSIPRKPAASAPTLSPLRLRHTALTPLTGHRAPLGPQAASTSVGRFSPTGPKDGRAWENAQNSQRRAPIPTTPPTDGRNELPQFSRIELLRRSRYHAKNTALPRQIRQDMAIYSVGDGIMVQAVGGTDKWNAAAQEVWDDFCELPEITGRFDMVEVEDLISQALDDDGEIFVLKVRDAFNLPRIQLVRAHRCWDGPDKPDDCVDGIRLDANGRPIAYRFERDDGTMREVPAGAVIHIYAPEVSDATRYVPPGQAAFNTLQDENEIFSMELGNRKEEARHRKIFKRAPRRYTDAENSADAAEFGDAIPGTAPSDDVTDPLYAQKMLGQSTVFIEADEDIEFPESRNPSTETMAFLERMHRDATAGRLPFEFTHDPTKAGGASIRLITNKAGRIVAKRQRVIIKRFLKQIFSWVIAVAITEESVPDLTANAAWYKCAFIRPPAVSVDAGRDRNADLRDLVAGSRTFRDEFGEYAQDWQTELRQRAKEMAFILNLEKEYGLPPRMLWNPSPTTAHLGKEPDDPNAEGDPNKLEKE